MSSELAKPHSPIQSTIDAFTNGFIPETLEEAKSAKRKELESDFNHRMKIARIRWNNDVIKPALLQVEKDWAEDKVVSTMFHVESDAS